MKYKHRPKQEYPDVQQGSGIAYSPERAVTNPVQRSIGQVFRPEKESIEQRIAKAVVNCNYGGKSYAEILAEAQKWRTETPFGAITPIGSSAIDWQKSHKAAEQERQEEEDIEKAIDQVENQKQQAGFYAGATERLGIKSVTSDMEFPKEWKGEFIPPAFDLPPAEPAEKKVGFYYGGPWKEQLTERDEREGCAPWYAMAENGVVETRPWEGEGEPNPDYRTPTLFERFNSLCTPAQYVRLKKEIQEKYLGWNILTPFPKELDGFTPEIIESL